jgi:hypothetical protein
MYAAILLGYTYHGTAILASLHSTSTQALSHYLYRTLYLLLISSTSILYTPHRTTMLPTFSYSAFRLTLYPVFIALITTVTSIVTMDPFRNNTLQYFAIANIIVASWGVLAGAI